MPKSRGRRPVRRSVPSARPTNPGPSVAGTRGRSRPAQAAPLRPIERVSLPALMWLRTRPRWLLGAVSGVLLAVGLFVSGIAGGLALAVVAAFLTWLLLLSWPALSPGGKVGRVLATGVVLAAAVYKFTGRA